MELQVIRLAKQERDSSTVVEESLKRIRRDLDRRIDEIKGDLREKEPKSVKEFEEILDGLREDVDSRMGEARESVDEQLEMGRKEIKKHPLIAVSIAVLVGLIIGMLFGRDSRR